MDPNSWSNYNPHYGRVAHNRYDMPLLDQQALNTGLGSLSSPLSPAHTALPTARPLASLTPMAYSHPLHNMSPFLDTVNPLQASYATQPPYKGMAVGQTGLQMDSFLASHVHHDPSVSMSVPSSRYLPPSAITSPEAKPMFSPELQTKDLSSPYTSSLSSHNASSLNSGGESKEWGLSNFLPSNSAGLGDIGSYSLGHYGSSLSRHVSDPPNHSCGKSISLRESYPSDPASSSGLSRLRSVSPVQSYHGLSASPLAQSHSAHSAHTTHENQRAEMRRLQVAEDLSSMEHSQHGPADVSPSHQSLTKTARSQDPYLGKMYEETYLAKPVAVEPAVNTSHSLVSREPSNHQIKSSPQPFADLYKRSPSPRKHKPLNLFGHHDEGLSSKSHGVKTSPSNMADMNYDPISPVPPVNERHYNDNFSTISLQDLNSISSHSDNSHIVKPEPRGKQQLQMVDYSSQEKGKQKKSKEQSKKKRSKNKGLAPLDTSDQVQLSSRDVLKNQESHNQMSALPQNYSTQECSPVHTNFHIQHNSPHVQPQSPQVHAQICGQETLLQMKHDNQHFQQTSPQMQHQNQHLQQTSPQMQHHHQYLQQTSPQAPHLNQHLQETSPQTQHLNQYLQETSRQRQHQTQHLHQKSPQIQHQHLQQTAAQTQHQNEHFQQTSGQVQHQNQYFQQTSQMQESSTPVHLSSHIKQEIVSPVRQQNQIKQEPYCYSHHQNQFEGQSQMQQKHTPHQNQPSLSDVPYTQHTQLSNAHVNNEDMQHQSQLGQWQPIKYEQQSPYKQQESQYEQQESQYEHYKSNMQHESHGQVSRQPDLLHQHISSDIVKQEVKQHHGSAHSHESDSSQQRLPPYYQVSASVFPATSIYKPDTTFSTEGSASGLCHSTVIQPTPPTIQAVADSTTMTKPRKGKGRKKKQQQALVESSDKKQFSNPVQDNMVVPESTCYLAKTQEGQTQPWLESTRPHPLGIKHEGITQDLHMACGLNERIATPVIAIKKETKVEGLCEKEQLNREGFESKLVLEPPSFHMKYENAQNQQMQSGNELGMDFVGSGDLSYRDTDIVTNSVNKTDSAIKREADCDMSKQHEQGVKKEPEKIPLAVTCEPEFDEDFQHLVPSSMDSAKLQNPSHKSPPKLSSSGSQAFLGSFVNFLSGKKGETLSSVTQSPVKRPPMPKYIPEPRRVKTEPPVDLPKKESQKNSRTSTSEKINSTSVWKSMIESRKGKRKAKRAEQAALRKHKKPKLSADLPSPGGSEEDESSTRTQDSDVSEQHVPMRRQSSRQALERLSGNKRSYAEDGSEDDAKDELEDGEETTYTTEEEVDYDSDKDPAWTPFAAEKSQSSVVLPLRKRRIAGPTPGKNKAKSFRPFSKNKKVKKHVKPIRPPSDSDQDSDSLGDGAVEGEAEPSPSPEQQQPPTPPSSATAVDTATPTTAVKPKTPPKEYQRGTFLIEKRDLTNYENFPVWRVSDGKMLQKYELIIEKGEVKHKSTFTYSSWTPLMHDQFQPVNVNMLFREKRHEIVKVAEVDRPKPPTDGSLERRYEDDPMVESFNVFLQILLSQALEPGFLKAIHLSEDDFYLGHMKKVDEMIQARISKIQKKVKWNKNFKEAVKNRPHVRELDRPNLQHDCQACKDSHQSAIKSVHLFGDPYDTEDLSEQPNTTTSSSEEFLIGKTATTYLMTYHSLVHYKYNLYKRCVAKVNLVKESEETEDNASVLDACLHNRAWVLKLFEDLKKLLEKP